MSGQLKALPEWYYYFAGAANKLQRGTDYLAGAAGFAASKAIRLAKTGSLLDRQQSPEAQRAWKEHFASDVFPTLAEVRGACAETGPRGRAYGGISPGVTPSSGASPPGRAQVSTALRWARRRVGRSVAALLG
jgi:hypothetical protein